MLQGHRADDGVYGRVTQDNSHPRKSPKPWQLKTWAPELAEGPASHSPLAKCFLFQSREHQLDADSPSHSLNLNTRGHLPVEGSSQYLFCLFLVLPFLYISLLLFVLDFREFFICHTRHKYFLLVVTYSFIYFYVCVCVFAYFRQAFST